MRLEEMFEYLREHLEKLWSYGRIFQKACYNFATAAQSQTFEQFARIIPAIRHYFLKFEDKKSA